DIKSRDKRQAYVLCVTAISLALTLVANFAFSGKSMAVAAFSNDIYINLQTDGIAVLFSTLFAVVWFLVAVFSLEYMKHEGEENRFFAYFIASLGALIGVAYADNLVTLYLFFEIMSLLSYVLVVHSRTNESLLAGRKYIYYSLFGASLGLIGIFYCYSMPWQRAFVEGGVVSGDVGEIGAVLNLLVILAVVGFGCKSGMFPLHSWLPTAHPQAPAPASSVLSGLITKAGILAIIRIVYFTVGADILVGSIAQKVLLSLSIITIFMGSMLAYKERVLKKRLAYSTVSQVSYIIFGIMLLNTVGVTGALLQVIFHALAKNVLFLCAGAIIYKTHKTNCDDLYGLGRAMPKTFACFTIAGMSLVG
ncbi:MAG: proton-conducting transporter membrane subunit, partial [Oscillospiraceae bacterium]